VTTDPLYGRDCRVTVIRSGRSFTGTVRLVDGDRRYVRFDHGGTGWIPVADLQPEGANR
jgi:hypothetical protein